MSNPEEPSINQIDTREAERFQSAFEEFVANPDYKKRKRMVAAIKALVEYNPEVIILTTNSSVPYGYIMKEVYKQLNLKPPVFLFIEPHLYKNALKKVLVDSG